MAGPFGRPLTFQELFVILETRFGCRVRLQDPGGIPDASGDISGPLYLVERGEVDERRFAFIEVYHPDVMVLPDYLRSICRQLGIDEGELEQSN